MQVLLGDKEFRLSEHATASCGYFKDIKEDKVDLTELGAKENITTEELEEFVRLLNDKPFDLSPQRLAFFASYFCCEKAAKCLVERKDFQDVDWKLKFLKQNPCAQFMVKNLALALVPQVVSRRR